MCRNLRRCLSALAGWLLIALSAAALLTNVAHADDPVPAADAGSKSSPAIPTIDQSLLLRHLAGNDDFVLVDARSSEEFAAGHIPRAVNIPHDALEAHADGLPEDPTFPVVVYCRTGGRASLLREQLLERGYTDVRVLGPSQIFWFDSGPVYNCGVPVEPASQFLSAPAE